MTIRASEAFQFGERTGEILSGNGQEPETVELEIEGDTSEGRKSGFSFLLAGTVVASSILSTAEPTRSVTELEGDAMLLAGSVRGETAGFVLRGSVVAAEFDEPEPTVRLDGTVVDTDQWPSVRETVGHGTASPTLSAPFSGDESASATLAPVTSVVTLEATDLNERAAFGVDVAGAVVDHSATTRVSADGDRVYGYLDPGASATVEVAGSVTRIDAGDGIEYAVSDGA